MRNITIALVTSLALASAALAQQPSSSPQQPPSSQQPSSTPSAQPPATQQPSAPSTAAARLVAMGQLVRVDTKAKTFTIRQASASSSSPSAPADPSRPSNPPSATPPSAAPPSAGSSSPSAMPTEFTYNDTTKVTGSEKTVEGLATMQGTEVTVHYVKQADKNVATEIEIKNQKS